MVATIYEFVLKEGVILM